MRRKYHGRRRLRHRVVVCPASSPSITLNPIIDILYFPTIDYDNSPTFFSIVPIILKSQLHLYLDRLLLLGEAVLHLCTQFGEILIKNIYVRGCSTGRAELPFFLKDTVQLITYVLYRC